LIKTQRLPNRKPQEIKMLLTFPKTKIRNIFYSKPRASFVIELENKIFIQITKKELKTLLTLAER
jgi:hypothetical protein